MNMYYNNVTFNIRDRIERIETGKQVCVQKSDEYQREEEREG